MIRVAVHQAGPEDKRSKAVRYFAGFLAFMLACTVISRGIYVYRLPQVIAGRAERRTISCTIEINGVVENEAEKAVIVKDGIRVSEILVQEGERVSAQDALFVLDIGDLEEKRAQLLQELSVMEQQLSEAEESRKLQEAAARKEKERAGEDLNNTVLEQDALLEAARKESEKAVGELADFPSFEAYYQEIQKKSAEYLSLKNAAEKPEAGEEEKEGFETFERTFRVSAEEEWKLKKEALEEAARETEKALGRAEAARENAVREAERRLEDASVKTPEIRSSQMELANIISSRKKAVSDYDALLAAEGMVTAGLDGTVEQIHLSAGGRTADGAAMILSDASRGMQFTASLTEEERSLLSEDSAGTISFSNGKKKLNGLPVEVRGRQTDGTYRIRADVSGMGLSGGEAGTLTINAGGNIYDCCVPLSAVHSSGFERYVLILTEKETFLGTEYGVERRNVVIEAKNEEYAALKDSPIGDGERIVIFSDRSVEAGDAVRMKEE